MKSKIIKNKIFVIAEIANSHQGNLEYLLNLIDEVAKTKADAIKFQKFYADELIEKDHPDYKLFKKLEFKKNEWKKIIKYAKTKKLKVIVDVFGIKSAKEISKIGIDGYKIHASDVTNPKLLEFFALKKEPVFISHAGAKINEIDEALKILSKNKKEIIIMYGHQGYPTKINDLNLGNISEIKTRYDKVIGISDHSDGSSELSLVIPLLAISMGAKVVEKHITLDRNEKRLDYQSALNPNEFKNLISLIRTTEKSLGVKKYQFSQNEQEYRIKHRKRVIAKKSLKKDIIVSRKFFDYKRINSKVESPPFFDFDGKKLTQNIKKGEILTKYMINNSHKIVSVIACRVSSGRLFAKPLQQIFKESILQLQLRQLKKSDYVEDIVLAISKNPGNEIFVEFAKQNKIKYVLGDDTDVLSRLILGANLVDADTIVRTTSENPFIYWEGLNSLIKNHLRKNNHLTTYAGLPLGSSIEVISKKALEISHKQGKEKHRSELCTLYINENPSKFKISRLKVEKSLYRPDIRLTVDTPQDLLVARIVFQNISKNNELIKIKSIIQFLDSHPKIKEINSNISIEYKRFN
jgi:N,N'-diacetyllegionaminate synthase